MEKTDNELIVEFMGHPSFEKDGKRYWRIISDKWDHLATESRHLRYESQWNDLMPVVEKIEADDNWVFTIFSKEVWLSESEYRRTARGKRFEVKGDSKIGAVYTVVVQYIKWYNSQPPRV